MEKKSTDELAIDVSDRLNVFEHLPSSSSADSKSASKLGRPLGVESMLTSMSAPAGRSASKDPDGALQTPGGRSALGSVLGNPWRLQAFKMLLHCITGAICCCNLCQPEDMAIHSCSVTIIRLQNRCRHIWVTY